MKLAGIDGMMVDRYGSVGYMDYGQNNEGRVENVSILAQGRFEIWHLLRGSDNSTPL